MGNILLIIPPFFTSDFQSLAAHNLQAVAKRDGYSIDIEYGNIEFEKVIGDYNNEFCKMNYFLLGERVFSKAAWGDNVGEQFYEGIYNYRDVYERDENPVKLYPDQPPLTIDELKNVERSGLEWVDKYVDNLELETYSIIGLSISYEQTNAAMAILKRIKKRKSDLITFVGGFNCEGIMSEGVASLDPESEFIDYIFSGESENSFTEFLHILKRDGIYPHRIIHGSPVKDLDTIPDLDYSDYFKKMPDKSNAALVLETSRGCWWGEKCQCRFCGTSDRVCFREKSTKRILEEIEATEKWGVDYLHTADLIMPKKMLNEVLPKFHVSGRKLKFYYEQKVSLTRDEMLQLQSYGVNEIQPGIESLSTDILKKMGKGTSLKENLIFLRNATEVGLELYWNMVWGIPGEKIEDYKKINELVPLLIHLTPPVGMFHMTMVRYSPYFNDPEGFGISNVEPVKSYSDVYPKWAESDKLAIIHRCSYERETIKDSSEVEKLLEFIGSWKVRWDNEFYRPRLSVCSQGDGSTVLLDTRGLEVCEVKQVLNNEKVEILLTPSIYCGSENQDWAIGCKAAVLEGEFFIPLAIIDNNIRKNYKD